MTTHFTFSNTIKQSLPNADVYIHFDDSTITHKHSRILQMDDYYPFGLTFNSYTRPSAKKNDFLYNGKEMQDELGLDWMDYGARMYDAAIGRWHVVDGMSEKYFSSSPYHYAGNNPIRNYDIDGNEFTDSGKKWAKKIWGNIRSRMAKNNKKINKKNSVLATGYKSNGKGASSGKMRRLAKQVDRLENNNAALNEVSNEIIAMDNSSQVYNVIESSSFNGDDQNPSKAATMYNLYTNAVDIIIPTKSSSKLGLVAHEFKHGYQFESGQASLTTYPGGTGFNTIRPLDWLAYDQQDEIDAYKRQGLFGNTRSSLPSSYTNRRVGGVLFPNRQSTMNVYSNSSHADLQQIANNARQAFRLNNVTYSPNR